MSEAAAVFSGVYPALVSPVKADGSVDEDALRDIVRWLSKTDVDGLYVCGGTGEGIMLPVATRVRILEVVMEERASLHREKKLAIIDHIGAVECENVRVLAEHAAALGVDAVSAIPPIYYGYGKNEIIQYYSRVSEFSEVPLIIYASAQSGVAFTPEILKAIAEKPMVRGIKFTGYDFYTLMRLRSVMPASEGYSVLNGGDEVLLFGLSAGADGGIGTTYNVMPTQFCELHRAFRSGDMAEAHRLQEKINRVITEMIKYPVIGSVKAILEMIGHPVGDPVFPNRALAPAEKTALEEALRIVGYPQEYL